MSEKDPTCLASLTYFIRERLFRQTIHTAEEYLKLYINDPVLTFFKAYGKLLEGRTQEAIRELETIKDRSSVSICATMALICAHKQCETVDREAVSELECHVKNVRKKAEEQTLFFGGLFLWLMGHNNKARDYTERILKIFKSSKEGLILKGWLEMSSDDDFQRNNAVKYLDSGIQETNNVFGMIGKVKYFMEKQNFTLALDIVNQILLSHPDFMPGLLLKMRLFMALQDWEQTLEITHRICQQDDRNLMAIQLLAIHAIVKDGDLIKAKEHLQALLSAAEISEPCSPGLLVQITQPISRLCGSNSEILQLLTPFAERLHTKAPGEADIANEIGYLLTLQDKAKEATRWYSTALKADTSSVPALAGLIRCQLMDGQLQEAANHLEFLREIQQSIGQSAEVALLQAQLAHKKGAGLDVVSPLLKEATELHFLALQGRPMGPEYFHLLHPNFIFHVVNLNLSYFQEKPAPTGLPIPFGLSHSVMILDPVVRMAPGLLPGAYHMAHVKFLAGDRASAQRFLDLCLEKDPSIAEVHLLQAKMLLHDGDHQKCFQSLETGISHNFQLRELPQYHLMKSRALRATGCLALAIQALKMVMGLPGVRRAARDQGVSISSSDRVSVYLELAEALQLNGEQHEATMVMQEAIFNFAGTPDEIHITMANVDLALAKDDTETALCVLRSITPNQPHYLEARQKMADIYLNKRKDRKLYIACYREVRDELHGPQTSIMLGDAYMNIQEPERAIEVYQEASNQIDRDATLSRKMGQAYVKTHQYDKVISHYESALKPGGQGHMFVDYAELLLKMRMYGKAQKVLMSSLHCEDGASLSSLKSNVRCLLLLVKAHYADEESVQDTLEKAYSLQLKVLTRVQIEQPEMYNKQRSVMATITCLLARFYCRNKDFENSKIYYNKSITYSNENHKVILELAQLYLENRKLVEAEAQCGVVLSRAEEHLEARMIYAVIVSRRDDYEEAIDIYHTLMREFPDNYTVLSKYILMLRGLAKLQDAPDTFKVLERLNQKATSEPGYHYCKGLFFWHMCRVSQALFHLNKARKDTEWGEQALELMVCICLNPDKETIGGDVLEAQLEEWGVNQLGDGEQRNQLGVSTALNLVKEFRPRTPQAEDKARLLHNFCLLASREPQLVQKALLVFTDMASTKVNNTAYLLAMGQAFMLLKQTPRARNQLKRLAKAEWSEEQADALEEAWLLLSDIYIQSGKYDIAQDLLRRCIKHNKSCSRAYEYLGFINESEQSYKDASELYEQAWLHSNRVNPRIGFRLAFNYLKFKSYTEAIDVCHKVLAEHPDYPLIQTEILERAQSVLRP